MHLLSSHVRGPTKVHLLEETLGAFFGRMSQDKGAQAALVCTRTGARLSYAELLSAADHIARGFLALALAKGDRIGIWSPNRVEWILTQIAAARLGLVLVTINPAYRRGELAHALSLTGCRALVLARAFKTSDYYAMLADVVAGGGGTTKPDGLEHVIGLDEPCPPGMMSWSEVEALGAAVPQQSIDQAVAATNANEAINIQFTSGTTGLPKGATLTHRNILNNGFFVGRTLRLGREDRLCLVVPLYHCFGLVMAVLGAFTHGAAIVLAGESFTADSALDTVEAERCTVLYGVPTMFVALLEAQRALPRDVSSLRTGIMAGSPCPIEVMRRVLDDLHVPQVTICYGMTETSPVSFQSDLVDPVERRVTTVGRVHPHVEVKLVDAAGATVPRGETGELLTRGYSVMKGYWNDAPRTREAVDNEGWMHTGDLATLDRDGYCRIVGRLKDMVIRGGENIYPREVEEFLFTHPDTAEVHVFGVPDLRFGEELCAWIRLRPGARPDAQAIRDWCRERVAHFKIPRYIEFVDEFPLTATGKVQKYVMRRVMSERLGLDEARTA